MGFAWQSRYYEHDIRAYIGNNPLQSALDDENRPTA